LPRKREKIEREKKIERERGKGRRKKFYVHLRKRVAGGGEKPGVRTGKEKVELQI
jgi:hypothetical protein